MWAEVWSYVTTTGSMLGFVGSMIALLVNVFITTKGKKEGLRAYIDVERITANPKLDNYHYQKGSKLICTEEYEKLLSLLGEESNREMIENGAQCTFLKIKNMSSNPCFGMKIKLMLQSTNDNKDVEEIDIYVLQGSEELYIPFLYPRDKDYPTTILKVTYKTLANENMTYENKTTEGYKEEFTVIQSIYVRKWFINRRVIHTPTTNLDWRFLK